MKRHAILIEASGVKGEKGYLEGAVKDVERFRTFLLEDAGGAWEANEITTLRNPSRAETLAKLASVKNCDYTFVTASGHGYHTAGSLGQTRLHLRGTDEIAASELNSGSKRCTVVMDCCRHVTKPAALQFAEERYMMAKAAKMVKPRIFYRQAFDSALEATEFGCSYFYSCGLNEAAQEDDSGGYYSRALVVCARQWHENLYSSASSIFDVVDAHNGAAKVVTSKEPQQKPEQQAGRRLRYFPFAVHP